MMRRTYQEGAEAVVSNANKRSGTYGMVFKKAFGLPHWRKILLTLNNEISYPECIMLNINYYFF